MGGGDQPEPRGSAQTACLQFGRRHTGLVRVDCFCSMALSVGTRDGQTSKQMSQRKILMHAHRHVRMRAHAKDTWAVGAGTSTPGRSPPVLKRVLCHASQLSDSDTTSQDTVTLAGSHDSTTGGMSSCVS